MWSTTLSSRNVIMKQKKCVTEMKQQNCSGEREQAKKNTQERQKFKTRTELENYFLPGITTRQRLSVVFMTSRKNRNVTFRRISFHHPQARWNPEWICHEHRNLVRPSIHFAFSDFCLESFRMIYNVYRIRWRSEMSEVKIEWTKHSNAIILA